MSSPHRIGGVGARDRLGELYYPSAFENTLVDVNEYVFRYNHRDDAQAMFDAVADRAKRVRSGKHGEYSPVGE